MTMDNEGKLFADPKTRPHLGSAIFAASSGMLFGYDLGLVQGAIHSIKKNLELSDTMIDLVVAAAKVGAVFGPFIAGYIMSKSGRRVGLMSGAFFFFVGPIVMAAASVKAKGLDMLVGRFIIGLGIGQCSVVVPAYLGETTPSSCRGFIVELYEVSLVFGMIVSSAVDYLLSDIPNDWRYMVGIPTIPGFFLMIGPIFLPESPRWLVMKSREKEALKVLHKIRHAPGQVVDDRSTPEVENELLEIWSDVKHVEASEGEVSKILGTGSGSLSRQRGKKDDVGQVNEIEPSGGNFGATTSSIEIESRAEKQEKLGFKDQCKAWYLELFHGPEKMAMRAAIGLAIFNQFSGSTAITNYAVEVLREIGLTDNKKGILLSSGISFAKLLGIVVSMFLVDSIVGRRPLLIGGGLGMSVCMVLLTVGIELKSIPLVIVAESAYMLSFAVSWAGIFWVLMSEIFSMRIKAVAVSIATSVLFAGGALANILYHILLKKGGPLFGLFFAMVSLLSSVFVFMYVPETKGKSLKEIQKLFQEMSSLGILGKKRLSAQEGQRLINGQPSA